MLFIFCLHLLSYNRHFKKKKYKGNYSKMVSFIVFQSFLLNASLSPQQSSILFLPHSSSFSFPPPPSSISPTLIFHLCSLSYSLLFPPLVHYMPCYLPLFSRLFFAFILSLFLSARFSILFLFLPGWFCLPFLLFFSVLLSPLFLLFSCMLAFFFPLTDCFRLLPFSPSLSSPLFLSPSFLSLSLSLYIYIYIYLFNFFFCLWTTPISIISSSFSSLLLHCLAIEWKFTKLFA